MHKHEFIFGKQQQFQQKNWLETKYFEKYECFMFILKNMPFFNFGS